MSNENDRCFHVYPSRTFCAYNRVQHEMGGEFTHPFTPAPQASQPVTETVCVCKCGCKATAYPPFTELCARCEITEDHAYKGYMEHGKPTEQPVCEHNHTMRHAYSHIPQGYDECSLCGATRVEGEDWRSATAQPVNPAHDKCVCGHIRAFDCHRDLEDMNFAPAQISCERGLHDFAAATEGERCDNCKHPKHMGICNEVAYETEDEALVYCGCRQPTETEVTG